MINDGGCFFVHQACAMWSFNVQKEPDNTLRNVPQVVQQSLTRKCTFCSRYGASLTCKMACSKYFHLPCVAAAGGFQIIQSCSSFCKEHLGQVPLVCAYNGFAVWILYLLINECFRLNGRYKLSHMLWSRRCWESNDVQLVWRSLSWIVHWCGSAAGCKSRMAVSILPHVSNLSCFRFYWRKIFSLRTMWQGLPCKLFETSDGFYSKIWLEVSGKFYIKMYLKIFTKKI